MSQSGGPAAALAASAMPGTSAPMPAAQEQWFWAGACIDSMLRFEAIPDRLYYASDGHTIQRPIDAMAAAGFNAARVQTYRHYSSAPTTSFDNSGNILNREENSRFDPGGIDIAVQSARLAKEHKMKFQLTINLGADIPLEWQKFSYAQMLEAIDGEVRRQLLPFLRVGLQPDIILFENEDSVGVLYNITLPTGEKYARGFGKNPNVSAEQVKQERCGQLPTGHFASYPQLAGYYKQEILSCSKAISDCGLNPALTRCGLHSQLQYIDWRHSFVYDSTKPDLELAVSVEGTRYTFEDVIPDYILNKRAADMLDIFGFSSYPVPLRPDDISSTTSMEATFSRLRKSLALMDGIASRYGKNTSGPFAGQYRKQGLAVEYASRFKYPDEMQQQQQHTQMYFQTLQTYPWVLGAMWWEPTWCFNNWCSFDGSLYHRWYNRPATYAAPTPTLTYWGSFARSWQLQEDSDIHTAGVHLQALSL